MKFENLKTIDQMVSFIDGTQPIIFVVTSNKKERYELVEQILQRFKYSKLKRNDKGKVIQFLIKISSYSRQQITRMIERYINTGKLKPRQQTLSGFETFYKQTDKYYWHSLINVMILLVAL